MCDEPLYVSLMVTSSEYEDQRVTIEMVPKPHHEEEAVPPEPDPVPEMEM